MTIDALESLMTFLGIQEAKHRGAVLLLCTQPAHIFDDGFDTYWTELRVHDWETVQSALHIILRAKVEGESQ